MALRVRRDALFVRFFTSLLLALTITITARHLGWVLDFWPEGDADGRTMRFVQGGAMVVIWLVLPRNL